MTLQSFKLFDHCSVGTSFDDDTCGVGDCGVNSTVEINPSTSLPMLEGGCVDVSGTPFGATDSFSDPVFQEDILSDPFSTVDTSIGIENSSLSHDISDSGFMLNDDGGMITFDDDNGAADWGMDGGISMNSDDF